VLVNLAPSEVVRAVAVGQGRQRNNAAKGFRDKYGGEIGDGEQKHVDGALAEAAYARAMGLRSVGVLPGPDSGADVGDDGVRSTRRADGCLLLHPSDDDDRRFVLVVRITELTHRLVGACYGRDGKRPQYWREDVRHPAYFVPQNVLKLKPWGETRCPVCQGPYHEGLVATTKLYCCENGCTGRRIASELGERLP